MKADSGFFLSSTRSSAVLFIDHGGKVRKQRIWILSLSTESSHIPAAFGFPLLLLAGKNSPEHMWTH